MLSKLLEVDYHHHKAPHPHHHLCQNHPPPPHAPHSPPHPPPPPPPPPHEDWLRVSCVQRRGQSPIQSQSGCQSIPSWQPIIIIIIIIHTFYLSFFVRQKKFAQKQICFCFTIPLNILWMNFTQCSLYGFLIGKCTPAWKKYASAASGTSDK